MFQLPPDAELPTQSYCRRIPYRGSPRARNVCCAVLAVCFSGGTAQAGDCGDVASDPSKLGVARVVEIDTASGPVLGKMTTLPRQRNFLAPYEVVLTFDDGPMPWITRSILATLARHCTRATFFSVGKMAVAYPSVVREEMEQGHTVGTHTWSHPLNLKRLTPDAAEAEIERGFAAVTAAAGRPIAPFFRFPGLSDSTSMVAHLTTRHVASFTVDVVSNDSFISDAARLTRETMAKVDANQGGIILFHDIKASTAKALPDILAALAARGYGVVHLVPKVSMQPRRDLMAAFEPQVARAVADKAANKRAVPFYGLVGPERVARTPTGSLQDATALPAKPTLLGKSEDALDEDTHLSRDSLSKGLGETGQSGSRGEWSFGGWSTTICRSRP